MASLYINLGTVESDLGNYDAATKWLEKGLTIQEKLGRVTLFCSQVLISCPGEDDAQLAASYNNLGTVKRDMGCFEEAKALFEASLEIQRQHLGACRPPMH